MNDQTPATPKHHWEDLVVGSTFTLGSVTPTREQIIDFATQFDPQPFHLNDEAAKHSVFGALCASGWHTCSMAMRLMVDGFLKNSSSLGSPGLENIRWLKPVFPGDTLTLSQHVLEKKPMARRPKVGLVRTQWEFRNQHDQPVMQMEGWGMFGRRKPADPAVEEG